jgi:hypothetical protein
LEALLKTSHIMRNEISTTWIRWRLDYGIHGNYLVEYDRNT